MREATGLAWGEVAASARAFLDRLPDWARLYLRANTCPDRGEVQPLVRLAQAHQIASHHYKARQLGVTRKKGEFERGHERTLLGEWLASLGLAPQRENVGLIETAFTILCREALQAQGLDNGWREQS